MTKRGTPHLSLDHRLLLCAAPLTAEETHGLIRARMLGQLAAPGKAYVVATKHEVHRARAAWQAKVRSLQVYGATPRAIEGVESERARYKEAAIRAAVALRVHKRWATAASEACIMIDRRMPKDLANRIRLYLFG